MALDSEEPAGGLRYYRLMINSEYLQSLRIPCSCNRIKAPRIRAHVYIADSDYGRGDDPGTKRPCSRAHAACTVLIEIIIGSEILNRAQLIDRVPGIADVADGFAFQQRMLIVNPVMKGFMGAVDGLIAEIKCS